MRSFFLLFCGHHPNVFYFLGLIRDPHGTRVQASDVFNSCARLAERSRTSPALSVCVCVFHLDASQLTHLQKKKRKRDAAGDPREATADLGSSSWALQRSPRKHCKHMQTVRASKHLQASEDPPPPPPPPLNSGTATLREPPLHFGKFRSGCLKTAGVTISSSLSGLSSPRLIFICYWFKSGPAGEPANPRVVTGSRVVGGRGGGGYFVILFAENSTSGSLTLRSHPLGNRSP